ncbi:MAG: DUF1016 family protein [Bacteroidales bacterium]|nr:DUF1016 family protein [Bacteroidales bacterium]
MLSTKIKYLKISRNDFFNIGLLICKTKNNIIAQYALESSNSPIGISEYESSKFIPDNFKSSLPTIQEIEEKLSD